MTKCVKNSDCPKYSPLGPVFSLFSESEHFSECHAGGGYTSGYIIKCKTCGEKWEETNE
jgi:hypothetical protein